MITLNGLEVGQSYEPIAVIRNTADCAAAYNAGTPAGGTPGGSNSSGGSLRSSFQLINIAYAGGRSSSPAAVYPIGYPSNLRTESPFGSNGSFPVRARIDVGNNTSYEWTHYLNAVGPVADGSTYYLKLPAFSTSEVGSHIIEVVTDIRHSVDAGRGCFAPETPASTGWGCVREASELDNDRSESFTTANASTTLRVAVDVSDVTVRAGSMLSEVPFITINTGRGAVTDYRYRVTIGSTQYASATRSTNLAPTDRETIRANGSFTASGTPTTIPLIVCARVATSSESCDTARLIVVTPQCSDTRDNDTDGTQDTNDPGCFADPLDPTTYDPNDDNEGDMATTSPSVSLEFRPVTNPVQYNSVATLAYVINGPVGMNCTVTGGGTNITVNHRAPQTAGQVVTLPVTNEQQYWLRCTTIVGGSTLLFERTTRVEVLPLAQET
jgi:hypothetical protein